MLGYDHKVYKKEYHRIQAVHPGELADLQLPHRLVTV
jgi:hypothetical protein